MVDTPIGTNSPNYTLVSGDLGATIYCRITATNASGSTNAISNVVGPITAAALPANAGGANLPNIADTTPEVTIAVSCTTGTWTGDPTITYAYQWKRGGTNVGTDSSSYTPVVGDIGATLQCVVMATNGAGSASATSNTTGAVAAAPAGGSVWSTTDNVNAGTTAFSNSDRTIAGTAPGWISVRGTQSRSTGKLYFEITVDAYVLGDVTDSIDMGIASAAHTLTEATSPGEDDSNGVVYHGGTAYVSTRNGVWLLSWVRNSSARACLWNCLRSGQSRLLDQPQRYLVSGRSSSGDLAI